MNYSDIYPRFYKCWATEEEFKNELVAYLNDVAKAYYDRKKAPFKEYDHIIDVDLSRVYLTQYADRYLNGYKINVRLIEGSGCFFFGRLIHPNYYDGSMFNHSRYMFNEEDLHPKRKIAWEEDDKGIIVETCCAADEKSLEVKCSAKLRMFLAFYLQYLESMWTSPLIIK